MLQAAAEHAGISHRHLLGANGKRRFEVSVSDPEKKGEGNFLNVGAHTTYKINTTVCHDPYSIGVLECGDMYLTFSVWCAVGVVWCGEQKETSPGKFSQSSVVRRFNDFVWLHTQLSLKFKGFLIPPIPDKQLLGQYRTKRPRSAIPSAGCLLSVMFCCMGGGGGR